MNTTELPGTKDFAALRTALCRAVRPKTLRAAIRTASCRGWTGFRIRSAEKEWRKRWGVRITQAHKHIHDRQPTQQSGSSSRCTPRS